jgi:hypothetical protein
MSTTNKTKTLHKKKMTPKSQTEDSSTTEEGKKELMKGIVAFVDVKAEGIETSDAISKKIEEYGGKVKFEIILTKSRSKRLSEKPSPTSFSKKENQALGKTQQKKN